LYVLGSSERFVAGLFGTISNTNVTIKNLGVYIGAQGITASVPLSFDAFAGGLVGVVENASLTIIDCYVKGNVSATRGWGGGFVGQTAGGLIGRATNSTTTISTSFSNSTVSAVPGVFETWAGGLIGLSNGPLTISNSYATGDVSATGGAGFVNSGGLVGAGYGSTIIENSYAIGDVSASAVGLAGGIVGTSPRGSSRNSYRLSTQDITGSVINNLGTPLTEAQMRQQASFTGWDFNNVWSIDEFYNDGMPYLRALRRAEPALTIAAPTVLARAGQEVTFEITLTDNPGVKSINFSLNYDNSKLEFVTLTAETGIAMFFDDPIAGTVGVAWLTSGVFELLETDGKLFTAVFRVKDTFRQGESPLGLSGQATNLTVVLNTVFIDGAVIVYRLGKIFGDGPIDMFDAINIQSIWLDGLVITPDGDRIPPTPEQLRAADINGDGRVDANDLLLILRHLAGDPSIGLV